MLVIRTFKHGGQAVIVALRQRIVLVRVAVRALHRKAQDGRAEHIDFIGDHVQPVVGEIHFALAGGVRRHPQERRGDEVVHHLLRDHGRMLVIDQLVACDLLLEELVVRFVVV